MPVVSLPWRYLTVPLGGLFIELASMTFAPLTVVPPPPPDLPPPLPLLLELLELLPQALKMSAHAASALNAIRLRIPLSSKKATSTRRRSLAAGQRRCHYPSKLSRNAGSLA